MKSCNTYSVSKLFYHPRMNKRTEKKAYLKENSRHWSPADTIKLAGDGKEVPQQLLRRCFLAECRPDTKLTAGLRAEEQVGRAGEEEEGCRR